MAGVPRVAARRAGRHRGPGAAHLPGHAAAGRRLAPQPDRQGRGRLADRHRPVDPPAHPASIPEALPVIRVLSPRRLCARFLQSAAGSATVEFVILVPLVLMMLLSSIDYGVVMLRQVFLDRAVDMAAREVRLGQMSGGFNGFRDRICARTFLLGNCARTIAIEMRPISTATWAGLDEPARCVNRAEDIAPMLEFNPGAGRQELMLIRVCVAADPFIRLTGMVLGMQELPTGGYAVVSRTAWVNEPT
jgi:hypothetical protein